MNKKKILDSLYQKTGKMSFTMKNDYLFKMVLQSDPAIHIGFLDFDLPGTEPEFYATYRMLNIKNHAEYSSKFTLSVVSLNHINLATEEDRKYEIDRWARLFAATTWEEIKMLAEQDKIMEKTGTLIVRYLDEDERARQMLEAREEIQNRERAVRRQKEQLEKALADATAALADKDAALADKDATILDTKITAVQNMLKLGNTEEQILSCGYTLEEIESARKRLG